MPLISAGNGARLDRRSQWPGCVLNHTDVHRGHTDDQHGDQGCDQGPGDESNRPHGGSGASNGRFLEPAGRSVEGFRRVPGHLTDRDGLEDLPRQPPHLAERLGQITRGFTHLRVDGEFLPTTGFPRIDRFKEHTIELPVAAFDVTPQSEAELRAALAAMDPDLLSGGAGGAGSEVDYARVLCKLCPDCWLQSSGLDEQRRAVDAALDKLV